MQLENQETEFTTRALRQYRQVDVVNCGGTINMAGDSARRPAGGLEALLREIDLAGIATEVHSPFSRPPDSSNIGESEWLQLIELLERLCRRKSKGRSALLSQNRLEGAGGIVVTHGTDTLALTARVADLELSLQELVIPVIFTGSHLPPDRPRSDAKTNLAKSIFCAKEFLSHDASESLQPGVYVVIGKDIHLASRLAKVRTAPSRRDNRYFYSEPDELAGEVTSSGGSGFQLVVNEPFQRQSGVRPPTGFINGPARPFGVVEHLVVGHDTPVAVAANLGRRIHMYRALSAQANRSYGAIVQGDFSGGPKAAEIVSALASIKAPVFFCSKKAFEACRSSSEHFHLLPVWMSADKARLKLSWLLRRIAPSDFKALSSAMTSKFDEIPLNSADLSESSSKTQHACKGPGHQAIVVYPDISSTVIKDACSRVVDEREAGLSSRSSIDLHCFGDGHLPTQNMSIWNAVAQYCESDAVLNVPDRLGDEINDIEEAILRMVKGVDPVGLDVSMRQRYSLNREAIYSALHQGLARQFSAEARDLFAKTTRRVAQILEHRIDAEISNLEKVICRVQDVAKYSFGSRIQNQIGFTKSQLLDLTEHEIFEILRTRTPELFARRILKDALMNSCEALSQIGHAVDLGVQVKVFTQAVDSTVDLNLYENGQKLLAVGAIGGHSSASQFRSLPLIPK